MEAKLACSAKEAAEMLGLSEWKVRELCYTKQLRSLKVGQRLIIPIAALHEFLNPYPGGNGDEPRWDQESVRSAGGSGVTGP